MSSLLLAAASFGSPEESASDTQWLTWSSRTLKARLSSAVLTAATCVRMSTVTIVLDHPLDAPDLSFDAMETFDQCLLVVAVLHRASRVLWNRRSRSE